MTHGTILWLVQAMCGKSNNVIGKYFESGVNPSISVELLHFTAGLCHEPTVKYYHQRFLENRR
jgi:hypothetical protein